MSDRPIPWTTPLPELIDLLDLARVSSEEETDVFEGRHSQAAQATRHVFGGLVAAQALVAAGRTVDPARAPHSLHAYFLRPGDASLPLHLEVDRTRDGRSFSHRHVRAVQGGRDIAELSFSFTVPGEGIAHQVAAPATTPADGVRPDHEVLAEMADRITPYGTSVDAFEIRTVGMGPGWFTTPVPPDEPTLVWKRATGPTPDDPLLQAALFTYASDMRILHPAVRPHALAMYGGNHVRPATIDHAVWYHRPVRADEWTLWRCDSPWAADGRALVRATVYDAAGELVASAAQEGLIRVL